MKNLLQTIAALAILLFSAQNIIAQVSINTDDSNPDPSAMLDIKSTDKGLLIPRMDYDQREAISNPATGLLVYDTDNGLFYYYNGSIWIHLRTDRPLFSHNDTTVWLGGIEGYNRDFVFGSPTLGDYGDSETDQRFFFDKSKAAFRAGDVNVDQWDEANVGDFSTAFGKNTIASGKGAFATGRNTLALGQFSFAVGDGVNANHDFSLAMGQGATSNNPAAISIGANTTANGIGSVAFGVENTAHSPFEMVMGSYATNYTPNSLIPLFPDPDDRLFTIGNGTDEANRSDALRILKNGHTFINGPLTIDSSYTLPITDGATGQVLTTDGNGSLGWTSVTPTLGIIQNLSLSGNTLSLSGGSSVDLTAFSNSITDNDSDTKIQVEANTDEDNIRFDVAGLEAVHIAPIYADESNTIINIAENGPWYYSDSGPQWQSFTPATSGWLDLIKMWVITASAPSGGYTFSLYEGEGTNGTLLSSVAVPIPANDGFFDIPFPDDLLMQAGTIYSIGVDDGSGLRIHTDIYADGLSSISTTRDFNLRVSIFSREQSEMTVSGRLNINNAYTLPTTAGTVGQFLLTDGDGRAYWSSEAGYQTLSLNANTLNLTNSTPVDLSPFLDNTDEQNLTLDGNSLNLTNDATPVDLSTFLDNTDEQDLTLDGNSLSLTNDATPVDLSTFLDNTDEQALSLNTNILSLTNGGSVDLGIYVDNTDHQNLTLDGNSLSLTNDATPVDLSGFLDNTDEQALSLNTNTLSLTNGGSVSLAPYLDNTDNQDLSLSGSILSISGGNSISLAPINTNIFNNNGTVSGSRTLTFTEGNQLLTFQKGINTEAFSLNFKNAGSFFTARIAAPAEGGDNENGLDFRTKTSGNSLEAIGNTMQLTDNGTVTLPEYGQGNINGTLARVLGVTSTGEVIEKNLSFVDNQILSLSGNTLSLTNGGSVNLTTDAVKAANGAADAGKTLVVDNSGNITTEEPADRIVFTFDQTPQTTSGNGWANVSNSTGNLSVQAGDIVTVRITFSAEILDGGGDDNLKFQVRATGGNGCSSVSGGATDDLEIYRNNRNHSIQTSIQHTFAVGCSGTYNFSLQLNLDQTDDEVTIDDVQITAVKY